MLRLFEELVSSELNFLGRIEGFLKDSLLVRAGPCRGIFSLREGRGDVNRRAVDAFENNEVFTFFPKIPNVGAFLQAGGVYRKSGQMQDLPEALTLHNRLFKNSVSYFHTKIKFKEEDQRNKRTNQLTKKNIQK